MVTPVALSKVSSVVAGVQVTPDPEVRVKVTTPRIKARTPEAPAFANGRRAEATCPVPRVNGVGVPITIPAALKNPMLPAQEATGPLDGEFARFTTAICAVSVLPNPTRNVRVIVAPLCAMAAARLKKVAAPRNLPNNMEPLLWWLVST
jgi:hypothetical protein